MPSSRSKEAEKKAETKQAESPKVSETKKVEVTETQEKTKKAETPEVVEKPKVVETKKVEVAVIQEKPKAKLVKVRFIENHTFNKGINKLKCKKGDIEEVEPHLANKFVGRKIAYILG